MARSDLRLLDVATDMLIEDLTTALATPVELLQSFSETLQRDQGFRFRDEAQTIKQWAAHGQQPTALVDTIAVLRQLFDHGVQSDKRVDELLGEIEELCSAKNIEGFDQRRDALAALLVPSDTYLERRIVAPWAKSGFRRLVGLDTAVELRAAYRSAGSEELLGLVPMAILRVTTKYDADEDQQSRRLAMQLTEEDIDRLIDRLELSKRRLAALKRTMRGSDVKVYDDLIRGEWKAEDDE